jgi:hypothetical protein
MAMSENSKVVFGFLQDHRDEDFTADAVAEALGLTAKQVNGSFTSAIQKKGLGYREETEITLPDGTHKAAKFLRLNDEGMNYDVNSEG